MTSTSDVTDDSTSSPYSTSGYASASTESGSSISHPPDIVVDPPTPGVEGCRDNDDLAAETDSGDGEKAADASADVLKDTHLHDNDAASDGSKVKVSSQPTTNVNTKQLVC